MIELDRFDFMILQALQLDGRSTQQTLAQTIALSSSQIGRRIQRLEKEGIISGYYAKLNPEKIGLSVTAFVSVWLERHGELAVRDFASSIAVLPEIIESYAVSGNADYWLRVVTPDLPSLSRFIMHKLMSLKCVRSVTTNIALEAVKIRSDLPLNHFI